MRHLISKVCNAIISFILVILIVVTIGLLAPNIIGYKIFGVISGSMEPKFRVGSIVYVKKVEPEFISVGEAITFSLENSSNVVATHRVIAIDDKTKAFITKGDANDVADGEPVAFERLIGRAEFSIPYVGYLARFIQTKKGILTGIAVLLFIILLFLVGELGEKEEIKKENSKK